MVAFRLKKHFGTQWPGEDGLHPRSFPNCLVEPKVLVSEEWRCWVNKIRDADTKPLQRLCANWIKLIRTNLPITFSGNFRPSNIDMTLCWRWKYWPANRRDVKSKHVLLVFHYTTLPYFPFFSWEIEIKRLWNHLVLKVENLDRPKPGILVPNMSCTFVQIPHHDLVPFSALQINGLFFWSVGINLYHKKAHITKPSGF